MLVALDYIDTLKWLLRLKDEQIKAQSEQISMLSKENRKLFEQCNESTSRRNGKIMRLTKSGCF